MRFVYLTSYTFPSRRAEPYYVKSMAEAFVKNVGNDFTLVIRGDVTEELKNTNAISVRMSERLRTLRYFFWFPYFVFRNHLNDTGVVLMSHDPYLLSIFVFWRKVFPLRYKICSDWHQLFDDWKDGFIAKNSDYLIATCKRLQNAISRRCEIDASKILVAYGGIDLDLFTEKRLLSKASLRDGLSLPQNAFLVGYVGGFKSVGLEKGLSTMIRALPSLPHHVQMVFVGGSLEDMDTYGAMAKQLGVFERCIFIKKQVFDTVIEYEMAMDVLVIPYPDSHHFREYGFPMKVWEYMAGGRPIVYSNLEIISEILKGRATPFIPDDSSDLSRVIGEISKDNIPFEEVAARNITDVSAYTWDSRVRHIVDFIQST